MKSISRLGWLVAGSFCAALVSTSSLADVKLPAVFSDHMVLQSGVAVPVWGWADAGEKVTVQILDQNQTATADPNGKWSVKLAALKCGEASTMTVKGKNTLTVNDVIIGEVWLCSGQSNMAMTVDRAKEFEQEKAAANFPKIRMFFETDGPAEHPQETGKGQWKVCDPDNVGRFSATAYFFGREIHKTISAPVGLINSSVGGTPIEAWTSLKSQKDLQELKPLFERWEKMQAQWNPEKAMANYEKQVARWKEATQKAKAENKPLPRAPRRPEEPRIATHHPANLFNGKISPLIPYAIRGAIWYQGESNAGDGPLYHLQLTTLVNDWRALWGQGNFPFAWVQLPNFHAPQKEIVEQKDTWPLVRESMLKTLALPNTGMAITIDVGEAGDIHPKDKQSVGKRMAMWALADVYKQKGIVSSGPLPAGHKVNGSDVTMSFTHTDGGLVAKDGDLKGFAVAGADKVWHAASAKIVGDKVVVSSPDVKEPAAVRYAWADNPACNLCNGAGIPASPFRTDDWQAPR